MTPDSKRTEDWVQITTPEDKKMIASPGYIKKLLGLDLSNVFNRLQRLEYKIEELEAPVRHEEILRLLREHGKHNLMWIRNRVSGFHKADLYVLMAKNLIIESRVGTVTMYSCKVGSD